MTFWLLATLYVLAAAIAMALAYQGAAGDTDRGRRDGEGQARPGAAATALRKTGLRCRSKSQVIEGGR